MKIEIRKETPADFVEVENLTREAFWDLYRPGASEHLVVSKLRKSPSFIPELDLVATANNAVVGHIIYAKAKIVNESKTFEVLTFGPISVLPSVQKKGIGAELINRTMRLAQDMGYKGIVIFGNPDYYRRFGFINAAAFGITTSDGGNFDAFMAAELYNGSLSGISGKFYEGSCYNIDEKELEEFDKQFPFKEKHITDTQLKF